MSAQLLIGAGPLTVQLFAGADADKARTGAFLAALVVVRVPGWPRGRAAERAADAGRARLGRAAGGLQSLLTKVFVAMSPVALAVVVGTTALGPFGLKLIFGAGYVLSWTDFQLAVGEPFPGRDGAGPGPARAW